MKIMTDRAKKYAAKLDGNVSNRRLAAYGAEQKRHFSGAVPNQVQIEREVRAIISSHRIPPIFNHFYMNFAKKIVKLMTKHKADISQQEVCIEYNKWRARDLDNLILEEILCYYMPNLCAGCDYPAIENVLAGITFADGTLTGTYECPECPPEYGLPWTGQTTVYQANDDGTYQKGYTLTRPIVKGVGSHRFTDNGDGTISDAATGLMWVKDPIAAPGAPFNAAMNWSNAIINCEALNFATHTDWRLPNVKELLSIMDYEGAPRYIDAVFFPNTVFANYWSSTTLLFMTNMAFWCSYSLGSSDATLKSTVFYVRPVRLGKP